MIKLRRLKINKFRNVKPGCELFFDDGVNVLLGKNGTGKTTLLQLISAVFRGDFSDFKDESFELVVELAWSDGAIEVTVRNVELQAIELRGGLRAPGGFDFEFTVMFDFRSEIVTVRGRNDGMTVEDRDGTRSVGRVDPFAPLFMVHVAVALNGHLTDSLMADLYVPHAYRFDESLHAFRAITPTGDALAVSVQGSPPACELHFSIPLGSISFNYMPDRLAFSAMRFSAAEDQRVLTLGQDTHGELDDWAGLLGFDAVQWKADQGETIVGSSGTKHVSFRYFSYRLKRRDGTSVPHERLSYGQKRLLALLYYMEANEDVVIADEIVNGLHHEWIEAIVNRFGSRQSFLTSQNPLLFDFLQIDSADQSQRMFVLCSLDGATSMIEWRNMTTPEAIDFHGAMTTGVQYISEVLLQRGLW